MRDTKPLTRYTTQTDLRMRYLEWDGTDPPVLLIHGLTVCAEYWSLTARLLAPEHRVIAMDLRGHGQSEKPDWGYDYLTLAQDLEQLCAEAGVEGALVAGHSWGAGVALTLAASHPQRASHLALVETCSKSFHQIKKRKLLLILFVVALGDAYCAV